MKTHEVTNQVPPLNDINLFTTDHVLRAGIAREHAGWHAASLSCYGAELGSSEVMHLAELANRHGPELQTHDRFGHRIDQVDFHPAWHALLAMLRREGLHAMPWLPALQETNGCHVARAAAYFMHAQVEAGSLCPTTMTFAAISVLRQEEALFALLRDKLFSREHDPRDVPLEQKRSLLIGMGMTEKQGGSDVRSNTTRARSLDGSGRGAAYTLSGHKWFFSAPMSDAHLVLAHTDDGLSCFFVPRWRPDGEKNGVLIQRLKDKLGNRSNASSEVEFDDAYGVMVGAQGRGVATIIEMVNHTRLDCIIGSNGLMRQALVQAIHHARHRSAFGRLLADQPLMRSVLADLALESEAATLLMLRLASAFDASAHAPTDPLQRAWRRIVTPAAKFWICKRALEFSGECMEVWGGNGYVENGPMARLYREAPVNSIWEGSGNVMCLDVLRAMEREPQACVVLLDELQQIADTHTALQPTLQALKQLLTEPPEQREMLARRLVQQLMLTVQTALMLQHAPTAIGEAFALSRQDPGHGRVYGTMPLADAALQQTILQRAWPVD
ncbi:putative acyl-CoA dehydrogenase [Herbaspirillum sp. Sphag1AN]|uniref:isovaleryl-CoA dehydrogenase n=1 Tax=unclassified Herbaspirillum TaxID=2624150 RepID=UPI001620FBAD|nr:MULTISPECIES: isovaleryl-CoA dehydrogenase [unclassified Herbaspirillum]MBB3214303.1 putative acyl-CoA dehydrogenase [Herbaspirillum sp. Sphag1AN]MBB3247355.1 putative acyl-CoA dehydrogenase [Herbaspirillum sp. Sphag64]